MSNQKPMWTRCLGGFSVMWVTKLLISPVKKGFFAQRRPNLARNWHFYSFWARPCRLSWCPVGGLVGGCGAGCISQDTYLLFIIDNIPWFDIMGCWVQSMNYFHLKLRPSQVKFTAHRLECKWYEEAIDHFFLWPLKQFGEVNSQAIWEVHFPIFICLFLREPLAMVVILSAPNVLLGKASRKK